MSDRRVNGEPDPTRLAVASAGRAALKKTAQFRRLLDSDELAFLLEAHNAISAKIGEEAGFKGLWAGGLCMSGTVRCAGQ